jgi:DNA modification methylase
MKIADLKPAAYNPRKISDEAMKGLTASVERFGLVQPVIWNRRTERVVGGHQRLKVLVAEGVEEADVIVVDLPESEEKALNLALNSPSIAGEFTNDLDSLLAEVQADLPELFEDLKLDELWQGVGLGTEGMTDPDAIPEPPDAAVSERGKVYALGRHRLMCGDSSVPGDLDLLLAGSPVHLVNTDPPYNVKVEPRSNNAIAAGLSSFSGASHHQGLDLARHPEKSRPTGQMRPKDRPLENDFLPKAEFEALLRAWFGNIARVLEPGRGFYIWGGYGNCGNYPPALEESGLYFSQAIIWDKEHPVLTRKDFMGAHEWCFYGWREGAAHQFFGPASAQDLWHVKKVNPQSMVHLTEKPAELATLAMQYSSRSGENVLDLFGGSGSTLIGAEMTGRRAFLMEIDPPYCDVIRRRFAEFVHGEGCDWCALTPEVAP